MIFLKRENRMKFKTLCLAGIISLVAVSNITNANPYSPNNQSIINAFKTLNQHKGDISKVPEAQRLSVAINLGNWKVVTGLVAKKPANQINNQIDHILDGLIASKLGTSLITTRDVWDLVELYNTAPDRRRIVKIATLLKPITRSGDAKKFLMDKLLKGSAYFGGKDLGQRDNANILLTLAGLSNEAKKFQIDLTRAKDNKKYDLIEVYLNDRINYYKKIKHPLIRKEIFELHVWFSNQKDYPKAREHFFKAHNMAFAAFDRASINWIVKQIENDSQKQIDLLVKAADWMNKKRNTQYFYASDANKPNDYTKEITENLYRQKVIASAILKLAAKKSPAERDKLIKQFSPALSILALAWVQEVQNTFKVNDEVSQKMRSGNRYSQIRGKRPMSLEVLHATMPTEQWLASLKTAVANKVLSVVTEVQLFGDNITLDQIKRNIRLIAKGSKKRNLLPQPELACDLISRYLTRWTRTHNPMYYPAVTRPHVPKKAMHSQSMPLTRAKQIRAIDHLGFIVQTLKDENLFEIFAKDNLEGKLCFSLVTAFVQSHSVTEVYRISDIAYVFCGAKTRQMSKADQLKEIAKLPTPMLFQLGVQMHVKLGKQWSSIKTHKKHKSGRNKDQIYAEVVRGYTISAQLIKFALKQTQDYRFLSFFARSAFAKSEYQFAQKTSSLEEYIAHRSESFKYLNQAATMYANSEHYNDFSKRTVSPYTEWFNTILQASDLSYNKPIETPGLASVEARIFDLRLALIETMISNSKLELDEWHFKKMGVTLLAQLKQIPEHEKYFFAEGSLLLLWPVTKKDIDLAKERIKLRKLTKDSKEKSSLTLSHNKKLIQRADAIAKAIKNNKAQLENDEEVIASFDVSKIRNMLKYYQELLSEVKLKTAINGSSNVEKGKVFGFTISLVTTSCIADHSEYFARLLKNADAKDQQSARLFAQTHGKEANLTNYRNKFKKHIRKALDKNFEIHEIKFDTGLKLTTEYRGTDPDVQRLGGSWKEIPLAYVIVKPRVDVSRLPSIRLDVDFKDLYANYGKIVLPVRSRELAFKQVDKIKVDKNIEYNIIQNLNPNPQVASKHANSVILSVNVSGKNNVPNIENILDLKYPGYVIANPDATQSINVEDWRKEPIHKQNAKTGKLEAVGKEAQVYTSRTVEYRLIPADPKNPPKKFIFAKVHSGLKANYKCAFDDKGNLIDLKPGVFETALDGKPKSNTMLYAYIAAGALLILTLIIILVKKSKSSTENSEQKINRYSADEKISPLGAISLLTLISEDKDVTLSEEDKKQISKDIATIQSAHFAPDKSDSADAAAIAKRWVNAAKK